MQKGEPAPVKLSQIQPQAALYLFQHRTLLGSSVHRQRKGGKIGLAQLDCDGSAVSSIRDRSLQVRFDGERGDTLFPFCQRVAVILCG